MILFDLIYFIWSDVIWLDLIFSALILSNLNWFYCINLILSYLILFDLIWSHLIFIDPIWSNLIQSNPIQSNYIQPHLGVQLSSYGLIWSSIIFSYDLTSGNHNGWTILKSSVIIQNVQKLLHRGSYPLISSSHIWSDLISYDQI